MMNILNKSTVHIKKLDHMKEILSHLIKGGASRLQIIADFDWTITRAHKDGERCITTYGFLKQPAFVSDEFMTQSTALYNHYHPIEVDLNMSKEEKAPLMCEWYMKSVSLMPKAGIVKEMLPEMISSSKIYLREGCKGVFESLHKHNVPLLLFSAGIGDVLKEILCRNELLLPNIKVVSNYLCFDKENRLVGLQNDLIHVLNKAEKSRENEDYFTHVRDRSNIILLGDSLADLDMAAGLKEVDTILKIGFLNFNVEANLPEYLNSYDIVLTDDQTMEVFAGLLQSIL